MERNEYFLIATVGLLLLLGILIMASVSAALSYDRFDSPNHYLFHHLLYGLLPGIMLGIAAYKMPLALIRKWIPLALLLNLFLMVLVFVPVVGVSSGGASSWINLGFTTFQPSELLKLTFIIYLASWLSARMEKSKKDLSTTLYAFLVILGLIVLLLALQPDIGTLGIIIITALAMYFLANTPVWHSLIMFAGVSLGLVFFSKIKPYIMNRFLAFINLDIDPMGLGYQIKQALIAVGSGGIFGTGLGMSIQKFGFLPEPMADSIFACFAEETGFLGSAVLILLFMLFVWLSFSVAKNVKENFYKLTALGIVSWLSLQTFINIGSIVKIMPLTGVPLPFISYGGSALAVELIGIGILLNISKHA